MSTADYREARARVRDEAAGTEREWLAMLEQAGAVELCGVPTRTRRRSTNGGELDALEQLGAAELRRLRRHGWLRDQDNGRPGASGFAHQGETVDVALERLGDGDIDRGWDLWLEATRMVDAARCVKLGRRPMRAQFGAGFDWRYVAPVSMAAGVDVDAVLAGDETAALERDDGHGHGQRPGSFDQWADEYLARLQYGAKREWCDQYIASLRGECAAPAVVDGCEWQQKAMVKIGRRWDCSRAREQGMVAA